MNQDNSDQKNDDLPGWAVNPPFVVRSAIAAIKAMLPVGPHNGVDITSRTDLFSKWLGIPRCPPSRVTPGEKCCYITLPFENGTLDYLLVTYCENDDGTYHGIFNEAFRALRDNGVFVVAFLDAKSPAGKKYILNQCSPSQFDAEKIMLDLTHAGFRHFEFTQTLFSPPGEVNHIQTPRTGYGEGSFVVVQARKK